MAGAVDSLRVNKKFTLNNGSQMPAVGLGTFRVHDPDEVMEVVDQALSAGYRMFDTAAVYRNESHLKEAFRRLLPRHDLERDDIFITTKLSPANHGNPDVIKRAYTTSLMNLGLEYADLYLIHFPGTRRVANDSKKNTELRHATWESMVRLYDEGLVNAIGVSNFNNYHLELLMKRNHGVVPAVNQEGNRSGSGTPHRDPGPPTPTHSENIDPHAPPLHLDTALPRKMECLGSYSQVVGGTLHHAPPMLTPSLVNYVRSDLSSHVTGWPADILEKQANKFTEEAYQLGCLQCTRVSAELKCSRSLVRHTEIRATLQEQKIMYLRQQISRLEELKSQNSFMSED